MKNSPKNEEKLLKREEITNYESFYGQNERADQEVYSKDSINPAIMKLMADDAVKSLLTKV